MISLVGADGGWGRATFLETRESAQFEIQLPPPPDIQVSGVTAPTTGQGGQPITVSWTVTNQGFGPTNVNSWTDEVYLSPTTTLQTSGPEAATSLGTFPHAGSLDPTQGYTQTETVNVPYSISGSYYVIVDADIANLVYSNGTAADKINEAPNPIQIALVPPPPPANLQVTSIVPPAGAASGQTIPVVWTITNQGAGATPTDTWSDQIVLSAYDSLTSGSNEFDLGTFTHTGSLAAGAQYSDTGSVTLPTGISGTYFLFVIADSGDVADQGSTASSHFASVALPVALTPPPDLEVTSLQTAGPAAASGQPLTVNWTVTNTGPGATPPSSTSWVDLVYLVGNGVSNSGNYTSLGTFSHNGTLAIGAAYSQSETVTLPQSVSGPYTLFVLTDADHDVYQASDPLNHIASIPLTINQSPLPDLQVSTVAATASVYAGQPITVNWTVTNAGAGGTGASTWTDEVYLSSDQFVDPSSVDLGSVTHVGALAPGASYSASLVATVPSYASGAYYLVVQADSGDAVYEGQVRPSSTGVTPTTTAVTLAPPADLTVAAVTVPATGIAGQSPTTSITWTVTNQGANTAPGTWYDALYLSPNGVWSLSDPLIAIVQHNGDLAPGASYTGTTSVALPAVLPGNYYVVVRTDVRDNVRESDKTNNQLASTGTIAMSLPALTPGVPALGTIANGQDIYYQLDVTPGQTVDLMADFNQSAVAEFYVRYGAIPSRDQFDAVYNNINDLQQVLTVTSPGQGTEYILLYGRQARDPRRKLLSHGPDRRIRNHRREPEHVQQRRHDHRGDHRRDVQFQRPGQPDWTWRSHTPGHQRLLERR